MRVFGIAPLISFTSALIVGVVAFLATWLFFSLWSQYLVRGLGLSESLQAGADGRPFELERIQSIKFTHPSGEDYDDLSIAIPFCNIRVRFHWLWSIRIMATIDDGRRLRDWAVQKGVDVLGRGPAASPAARP
jgi:hypothetical protein